MKNYAEFFKAISNELRLNIFLLLLKEDLCVCELENVLEVEQSRISHALKILKSAGLVSSKRIGIWIIYSVNEKILKSKIVQSIKDEIPINRKYLKRLEKCKKENIRFKCNLSTRNAYENEKKYER